MVAQQLTAGHAPRVLALGLAARQHMVPQLARHAAVRRHGTLALGRLALGRVPQEEQPALLLLHQRALLLDLDGALVDGLRAAPSRLLHRLLLLLLLLLLRRLMLRHHPLGVAMRRLPAAGALRCIRRLLPRRGAVCARHLLLARRGHHARALPRPLRRPRRLLLLCRRSTRHCAVDGHVALRDGARRHALLHGRRLPVARRGRRLPLCRRALLVGAARHHAPRHRLQPLLQRAQVLVGRL
mmetsp:Transcript_10855/g.33707  ORF Transcript_10855/g.33707 Transcript_10855/m.33707 type:complete len:241 (+) Transcript_10855:2802-3524(+)